MNSTAFLRVKVCGICESVVLEEKYGPNSLYLLRLLEILECVAYKGEKKALQLWVIFIVSGSL